MRTYPVPSRGRVTTALDEHEEVIGAADIHVEEEAEEERVVEVTDTVIDPRTMMIWEE